MSDNLNFKFSLLLTTLILILTAASCLTAEDASLFNNSKEKPSIKSEFSHHATTAHEHTGAVKGLVINYEPLADFSDKYCCAEIGAGRSVSSGINRSPKYLAPMYAYSLQLRYSSQFVPSFCLRI